MFKLKGRDLHISRSEEGTVTIKSKKPLNTEDLTLRIYEVDGLIDGYLKEILGELQEDKTTIIFNFDSSDTEIEESNEIMEYWYEIRIDRKIIGYDEQKARKLYIYPTGSESSKFPPV